MAKFEVEIGYAFEHGSAWIEVEASTEEQAKEIALELFWESIGRANQIAPSLVEPVFVELLEDDDEDEDEDTDA